MLQSALLLLGTHHQPHTPSFNDLVASAAAAAAGSESTAAWARKDSAAACGRAQELESYVQHKCSEMASALAAGLQSRLDGLGAPGNGLVGAPVAEQILLIGRLCSAVASESRYLQVGFGAMVVGGDD